MSQDDNAVENGRRTQDDYTEAWGLRSGGQRRRRPHKKYGAGVARGGNSGTVRGLPNWSCGL